jgi:hypothetical protein
VNGCPALRSGENTSGLSRCERDTAPDKQRRATLISVCQRAFVLVFTTVARTTPETRGQVEARSQPQQAVPQAHQKHINVVFLPCISMPPPTVMSLDASELASLAGLSEDQYQVDVNEICYNLNAAAMSQACKRSSWFRQTTRGEAALALAAHNYPPPSTMTAEERAGERDTRAATSQALTRCDRH